MTITSAICAKWTAARTAPLLFTLSPMTLPTTSGALLLRHHEQLFPHPEFFSTCDIVSGSGEFRRFRAMNDAVTFHFFSSPHPINKFFLSILCPLPVQHCSCLTEMVTKTHGEHNQLPTL